MSQETEIKETKEKKVKGEKAEKPVADTPEAKLEALRARLNKDYGKGSHMKATQKGDLMDTISTGSYTLDKATGIGGIPNSGCLVELLGWESCGKSTALLTVMANALKKSPDKRAGLFDGEHSFSKKYAKSLGMDIERLDIFQPTCGEEAYDMLKEIADSGLYCVIGVDSQTSLKPRKVVEGKMETSHLGVEARMMGDAVPKMLNAAARNNIPILVISQFREKIGVMFGSPETTSGGHALKYYAHMRIRFSNNKDKKNDEVVGVKNKVVVVKNKYAAPFGVAEYAIKFGEGPDNIQEIADMAIDAGIVTASGAWCYYKDLKFNGKEALKEAFIDNPEFYEEIKLKVLSDETIL